MIMSAVVEHISDTGLTPRTTSSGDTGGAPTPTMGGISTPSGSGTSDPVLPTGRAGHYTTTDVNTGINNVLASAGIKGGTAKQTFINGQEVVGGNGKLNPQAAIYMYEQLISAYPSKAAQIKAAIKPYIDPRDLSSVGGNPQLIQIFSTNPVSMDNSSPNNNIG